MLKLEVRGLRELSHIANFMSRDFRKALEDTIDIVAEMIKEEARRIVPVRTGTLQRSIYHKKIRELEHEIGAAVYYAIFVEYGTSRMMPRSFLRPAIYKYQDEIRKVFRDKMDEWLRTRGE